MKHYNLTDEAKQDLIDIKAYLTQEGGVNTSRYVLKRIRTAINFLSRNPGAGHLREDLTSANLKFWPVFSYLIIYRADLRPIGIVRVIHGSRNITSNMISNEH